MKKVIVSIEGCTKCAMLKELCPGLDYVTLKPEELLPFARAVGVSQMPLVVLSGEVDELKEVVGD